jgi:hypothetical protein
MTFSSLPPSFFSVAAGDLERSVGLGKPLRARVGKRPREERCGLPCGSNGGRQGLQPGVGQLPNILRGCRRRSLAASVRLGRRSLTAFAPTTSGPLRAALQLGRRSAGLQPDACVRSGGTVPQAVDGGVQPGSGIAATRERRGVEVQRASAEAAQLGDGGWSSCSGSTVAAALLLGDGLAWRSRGGSTGSGRAAPAAVPLLGGRRAEQRRRQWVGGEKKTNHFSVIGGSGG